MTDPWVFCRSRQFTVQACFQPQDRDVGSWIASGQRCPNGAAASDNAQTGGVTRQRLFR